MTNETLRRQCGSAGRDLALAHYRWSDRTALTDAVFQESLA